jgi:hypothetical protein
MATPSSAIAAKFGRTAAPALSWKVNGGRGLVLMIVPTKAMKQYCLCSAVLVFFVQYFSLLLDAVSLF